MASNDPFVILFNGPPKSGKDTIAKLLREYIDSQSEIPTHMLHFATPMRDMAMNLVGESGFQRYNEIKDLPQPMLKRAGIDDDGFDSIRQFMIGISEQFMKMRYGRDIWGRILLHRYAGNWWGKLPAIVLIPDLGFTSEFNVVASATTPRRVVIVQTHREGTSFAGDSRNYVEPSPYSGVHKVTLRNDSTPQDALEKLVAMFGVIGFCSQVFPVR